MATDLFEHIYITRDAGRTENNRCVHIVLFSVPLYKQLRVLLFPHQISKMDFLYSIPDLTLVDDGSKHTTFAANVFEGRPPSHRIQTSQNWSEETEHTLSKMLEKSKSVKSVAFYIDRIGMMACFTMKQRTASSNARSTIDTVPPYMSLVRRKRSSTLKG